VPIWLFAFLPAVVALAGALWTAMRPPAPATIGAIQHFAAGVVLYAVAGELLPEMLSSGAIWPIVVGGGAGILAMLFLRRATAGARGPAGLVATSALDGLIDGLVLGLAFAAGARQGGLLAVALAIEFLFLGLSVAGAFAPSMPRWKTVAATVGIALTVPPGMLIAWPAAALPEVWQAAAFAFGLVALLYLVTEELLTEAHERPETEWGTAMIFVGFLTLAVIDAAMRG